MTEPASKEELDAAKDAILNRIDQLGSHNSAEHGAIVTQLADQNRATRAHIGSEVGTVRGDVSTMKNYMDRILKAMKRFLNRHGIGSDDL
jgi:hypothetical protein